MSKLWKFKILLNRTNQEEQRVRKLSELNNPLENVNGDYVEIESFEAIDLDYLWIFTGLVVAVIISVLLTIFGFFKYSMTIGVNIHDNMFNSLVRSPTKFFDQNPSGK